MGGSTLPSGNAKGFLEMELVRLDEENERGLPCHPMSTKEEGSTARRTGPEEGDRHGNPCNPEDKFYRTDPKRKEGRGCYAAGQNTHVPSNRFQQSRLAV
jgi:hypothetical protein